MFDTMAALRPPYTVQVGFKLDSIATAQPAQLALLADANDTSDPPGSIFCGIVRRPMATPTDQVIGGGDLGGRLSASEDVPYDGGFEASEHALQLRYGPAGLIECTVTPEGRAPIRVTTTIVGDPPPGKFGFGALRTSAEIHYVAIYEVAP